MPGVCDRPGTHTNLFPSMMSQAVVAEAVLSNVLHYINHTKHIRQGSAIACRNFLLSVCFHKHSFPKEVHSARKLGEITNIHQRTLTSHVNGKQCLRNIRYKPFAKGSASNYWGKHAVCVFVFCNTCVDILLIRPYRCLTLFSTTQNISFTGWTDCSERSEQSLE